MFFTKRAKSKYENYDIDDLPLDLQYKVLATGVIVVIRMISMAFLVLGIVALALWFGKLTIFLTAFQMMIVFVLVRVEKIAIKDAEKKLEKFLSQEES